jgi:hypothetical protein
MRHIIQILFIQLLCLISALSHSQENKINLLQYIRSNEQSKCVLHIDTLTEKEFYLNPETLPTFPGGIKNMEKFIIENAKFNFNIADAQGKINFEFIVNEKGEIINLKILQSLVDEWDNELIKTLKKMPKWQPGTCNITVPVKMRFSFKIILN